MNFKKEIYRLAFKPKRLVSNLLDTPAIILLYHRVIDLKPDPEQLAVSPSNFSDHLEFLRNNYNLLSIQEFLDHLEKRKRFKEGTVIITFDDGYFDNYLHALPVLKKNKAQAIFYVSTGLLNTTRQTWWDELQQVFFSGKNLPPQITIRTNRSTLVLDTSSKGLYPKAYSRLHSFIKYMDAEQRQFALDEIFNQTGIARDKNPLNRMMNFDELKELAASESSVIGAHTHNHVPLSILDYSRQSEEIKTSKDILEGLIHKEVKHFSYPYGLKKDFNEDSIKVCRSLGFEMVCANYESQVHRWSDKFSLPRFLVRNWDLSAFRKQIEGFFRY